MGSQPTPLVGKSGNLTQIELVHFGTVASVVNAAHIIRVRDIFSGEDLGQFFPADKLTIQVEPTNFPLIKEI